MRTALLVSLSLSIAACSAPAQGVAADQEGATEAGAMMPDDQHLEHIAEAGQLAGEIEACDFEWEPYYLEYMQSERRRAANEGFERGSEVYDQRIAFIGMFFGANQQQAIDRSDGNPCSMERAEELAGLAGNAITAARERE